MRTRRPPRWPGAGGCAFAADPHRSCREQPALWPAEHLPVAVILTAAPPSFDAARPLPLDTLDIAAQARDGPCAAIAARTRAGNHHLRLCADGGEPLAFLIPFDADFMLRVAAATRFHRLVVKGVADPPPAPWRLTQQQRQHLALALRALDGRRMGASQREIARVLFGHTIIGPAWVGSDLHARVKRALRRGVHLMRGGYRDLLAAPRRRHGGADRPR